MRIVFGLISFVFCLLISDSFLFRIIDTSDSINHFAYKPYISRSQHWTVPYMVTRKGEKIFMPEGDYGYQGTCELQIKRGFFFRFPAEVGIKFNGEINNYYCSIINRTIGGMVVAFIALCLMLYLIYEIIKKHKMTMPVYYSYAFLLLFILYQAVAN